MSVYKDRSDRGSDNSEDRMGETGYGLDIYLKTRGSVVKPWVEKRPQVNEWWV